MKTLLPAVLLAFLAPAVQGACLAANDIASWKWDGPREAWVVTRDNTRYRILLSTDCPWQDAERPIMARAPIGWHREESGRVLPTTSAHGSVPVCAGQGAVVLLLSESPLPQAACHVTSIEPQPVSDGSRQASVSEELFGE